MAEEIKHNGLTLLQINPTLVYMVCPKGRHYGACTGKTALEDAKALTGMYWDEVFIFGSAIYPEDLERMHKLRTGDV